MSLPNTMSAVSIAPKLKVRGSRKFRKKKQTTERLSMLKQEIKITEHTIKVDELCKLLNTNCSDGISSEEAEKRLLQFGPNALSPPSEEPAWMKLLKCMIGGFSLLLWTGAGLCFVSYAIQSSTTSSMSHDNLYLGVVLTSVVFISGCFTYYQEAKSSRIMDSFKKMVPVLAKVIRDGHKKIVPAEHLVVGDLVEVSAGDHIPADIRLVEASCLKVDNSSLTGESEPQVRNSECSHEDALEARNLVFYSTNAVEGSGRGIVVYTGEATVIGRIACLTSNLEAEVTSLGLELQHFIRVITAVAFSVGIACLIAALFMEYSTIEAVLFLIGIIVAQVPEGLLPTITVSLALTARRMASKNCLVRNLEAVETLGSTSVICSDKTGTLTQNRMSVAHIWLNGTLYSEDNDIFYEPYNPVANNGWTLLGRVMMLCNRAEFVGGQDNIPLLRRECIGDASEKAFLKFTEDRIGNVLAFRTAHPKLAEIPFNSANKFQVSIHHCQENDKLKQGPLLVMKGAPERVFERCSTIYMKGKSLPIVRHVREQFDEVFLKLGGIGERVLGFADCYLPRQPYSNKNFKFDTNKVNFPIKELRFLGFVSLVDPPRASVPYSIAKCREAGIQVVMVTGDHPVTAKAIARAVGIISPNSYTREELAQQRGLSIEQIDPRETTACVVHGGQLREMSTGQLDEILNLYSEIVFARTSPTQKLNIVESFQRRQKFVAVTGDGVNDSPALRRANIGVAMGISGSDVSKQVADMILLDDNFSTIVTGIEEGRVIFDNLKKSIAYTMTSKIPELLPFILFMLFDLPLMMGTVTILCIDLGTDMLPAISMAYEVAEKDIMKRKPRDPKKDRLVNARLLAMAFLQIGVMQALAALFTAFLVFSVNGFLPDRLYGLRSDWTDKTNKALIDSYGQEWTMSQRMELQYTVYTCFFVTVVIVQWTDLLICKTRRLSIFQHGCANNKMTFALFFETGLALLLQMVPGLNVALQLRPMRYSWWCAGLPWALLILIYDELRKAWIRRYPDGFIFEETYY